MKKYKVNVNGNEYEITLEVIEDGAPAAKAAPAPKASAPKAAAGAGSITSPMPGTILSVNVKPGDSVKKGAVLMILEAMKMENEIMAPADGKVVSVNVQKGTAVENGTVLCTLA